MDAKNWPITWSTSKKLRERNPPLSCTKRYSPLSAMLFPMKQVGFMVIFPHVLPRTSLLSSSLPFFPPPSLPPPFPPLMLVTLKNEIGTVWKKNLKKSHKPKETHKKKKKLQEAPTKHHKHRQEHPSLLYNSSTASSGSQLCRLVHPKMTIKKTNPKQRKKTPNTRLNVVHRGRQNKHVLQHVGCPCSLRTRTRDIYQSDQNDKVRLDLW